MSISEKPKKGFRRWTWKDNVYGVDYHLVVSSWKDFNAAYGEEYDLGDGLEEPYAFSVLASPGNIRTVILWFPRGIRPRTPRWIVLIAHEALHATLGVLNDRGIVKMNEDTEAATYYIGWVIEEIYKCLCPPKPKPTVT